MVRPVPVAEEEVVWRYADGSPLPLRVEYHVGTEPPDEALVTSVRAVVFSGGDVLVVRNPDTIHALPGGRREPGETFEETLRRELMEETGHAVEELRPLGRAHLHHLGPAPPGYPFPYPDFYWVVYAAVSDGRRVASAHDDYELEAGFEPVDAALERIDLPSRIYVQAALERR